MAQTYRTILGDTFDIISYKVFGDGNYTDKIMSLNSAYMTVVIFSSGISLVMPERTINVSSTLPPWKKNL